MKCSCLAVAALSGRINRMRLLPLKHAGLALLGFMLCSGHQPVYAAQLDFSSSLNPVGSGARAMGMGGAFIAVADDATAASWNPAGLVQLEKPELSIVLSYYRHTQSYHPSTHPEMTGSDTVSSTDINYASAAYPFVAFERNVVVSLNYQHLYDLTQKNNYTQNFGTLDSGPRSFSQNGKLYALSPALAVQLAPGLYLGGTLNIWQSWFGRNGWEDHDSYGGSLIPFAVSNQAEFSGVNGNIGLLWNFADGFSLGAVYKSAFDADLHVETERRFGSTVLPPLAIDATLSMPASYGIGLGYRPNDALSFSGDLYLTDWSQFTLKNHANGIEFNPVYGDDLSNGRLRDTIQVRLGAEYLFIAPERVIPVRCGLFYDPVPQRGRLDDYYGIALGTGYSTGLFSVDISWNYRFGDNVNGNIGSIEERSVDIKQHTLLSSLIWYF